MINILMNWWRLAIINYNFYIHLDGIYVCVFFFLFIFVLCLSHSDCVFVSHSFSLAPFAQYIYDDDIFFIVDCYQFEWISSHFVALRCWDSLSHNVWWTVVVLGIEIGVWKTDILGLWMSGPGASRHGHRISVCLACLPFCCICISICVGRQEIEKQNAKCRLQTEVRRCAMEIVPIFYYESVCVMFLHCDFWKHWWFFGWIEIKVITDCILLTSLQREFYEN